MEAKYGEPASGDSEDPRGYGLGLRDPGSTTPDQNDYEVAKVAMGRRIGLRLEACELVGCSATDRVIVAALAANEDISADEIIKAFNKEAYWKGDTFNWNKYLNTDKPNPRIRKTIIRQFVDGIDAKHKDKNVHWDYIERLINNE
jgi:hypothetical protein